MVAPTGNPGQAFSSHFNEPRGPSIFFSEVCKNTDDSQSGSRMED